MQRIPARGTTEEEVTRSGLGEGGTGAAKLGREDGGSREQKRADKRPKSGGQGRDATPEEEGDRGSADSGRTNGETGPQGITVTETSPQAEGGGDPPGPVTIPGEEGERPGEGGKEPTGAEGGRGGRRETRGGRRTTTAGKGGERALR